MKSEGYVGVTEQSVHNRFLQHQSVARLGGSLTLSKAIRKYGNDIVVTTLLKGSEEYCYLMENKLRPDSRIGWNIVAGGGKPPVFTKGHTDEAKAKIGKASKERAQSPAMLATYASRVGADRGEVFRQTMREASFGRLPWETSRCDKNLWARADSVYSIFLTNQKIGAKSLGKLLGITDAAISGMLDKFKKFNWNPNNDQQWLEWVQKYTMLKESK